MKSFRFDFGGASVAEFVYDGALTLSVTKSS